MTLILLNINFFTFPHTFCQPAAYLRPSKQSHNSLTILPVLLLYRRLWSPPKYLKLAIFHVLTELFNTQYSKMFTIILPVVLYGSKTWSLKLREERRLRVFENRVLRRVFEPKRDEVTGEWRKLHNEELSDLYSLPNIVRVAKSRRMRWAGHVARMGKGRGVHRVLVGKPEGKRPLGRPRRRWENDNKMDRQEVGGSCGDWMELAQDRERWRALVSTVRNLQVPKMRGISWLAAEPVCFSRRTVLHGVSK